MENREQLQRLLKVPGGQLWLQIKSLVEGTGPRANHGSGGLGVMKERLVQNPRSVLEVKHLPSGS